MIKPEPLKPATYIYGWQDIIVRVKDEVDGVKVRKATLEVCLALNAFSGAMNELCDPAYPFRPNFVRAGLGSYP